jgi:hypothetical protein
MKMPPIRGRACYHIAFTDQGSVTDDKKR